MTSEFRWPRLSGDQRLIFARPQSGNWQDGLRDLYKSRSRRGANAWSLSDWEYRRRDVLLTLQPTDPRMFLCLEIFDADAELDSREILVDPTRYLIFNFGVPVDPVETSAGLRGFTRKRSLDARDGNRLIAAVKQEYESEVGIFGRR